MLRIGKHSLGGSARVVDRIVRVDIARVIGDPQLFVALALFFLRGLHLLPLALCLFSLPFDDGNLWSSQTVPPECSSKKKGRIAPAL